jgi:hypothetical protein
VPYGRNPKKKSCTAQRFNLISCENGQKAITGGGYKYYGNGLYVDVKNGKSYVNWGQTWQEGAARAGKAYANGFGKILGGIGGR